MTALPNLSNQDFLNALYQYLPDGDAWPNDPDSNLWDLLSGVVPTFQRVAAEAAFSVIDTFPGTTVNWINEWNEVLNLPDPYFPANTLQEQQAQIIARLFGTGGCSTPFYQGLISAIIGTTPNNIIITGQCPFLLGWSEIGVDPINDWTTTFLWSISIPSSLSSMVPLVEYEIGRIYPCYSGFSVTTH